MMTIELPGNALHGLPCKLVRNVGRHGYIVVELLKGRRGSLAAKTSQWRKGERVHLTPKQVKAA